MQGGLPKEAKQFLTRCRDKTKQGNLRLAETLQLGSALLLSCPATSGARRVGLCYYTSGRCCITHRAAYSV